MGHSYENQLFMELDKLHGRASRLPELRFVINEKWTNRIKNVVSSWGPEREFDDGGYDFFRFLTGHKFLISVPSIKPEDLDKRLQLIERIAREQGKIKDYRKTRGEL